MTKHANTPQRYSTKEAAKVLQVDPKTVRNYIHRGWLKGEKKGLGLTSDFLIYKDDLDAFIKKRREIVTNK